MAAQVQLGRIGVWTLGTPPAAVARSLEALGYGAIWIGGSPGGHLEGVEHTLAATSHIAVATGIVNIWADDPATIAASHHRLTDTYPGRFLLGIGAGHRESVSHYNPAVRRAVPLSRWPR